MRYILRYLPVIFFFLFLAPCNAIITEINQGTGLPDRCINGICKDNRGLMWIGTQSGLCLYDGFEFKSLLNQNTINRVTINKMVYDELQDVLWLATEKGLYKIHCSTFKVETIGTGNKWYNNSVTDILLQKDKGIFASYKDGEILNITPAGKITIVADITSDNFRQIYPSQLRINDSALVVSMASTNIAYQYLFSNKQLSKHVNMGSVAGINVMDNNVLIHSAVKRRTFALDSKNDSIASFLKQVKEINNVASVKFLDADVVYVFCRPFSVFRIDFRKLKVSQVLYDIYPGRLYKASYIDDENTVWVGSTKGMLKVTREKDIFQNQLLSSPTISIRSFAMDEYGNKYAGTYSGLFHFDKKKNDWIKIGDQIPFAITNADGRYLYFVEEQFKLFRIEKKTGKIETGFYEEEPGFNTKINKSISIAADDKGKIWIGTNSGLAIFDTLTGMMAPYKVKKNFNDNIEVRHLKIMDDNSILLCTNNGVYKIDDLNGVLWHLNTTTSPAISSNTTNFANIDANGNIWICTEGGGLNLVDKSHTHVSVLDTKTGLSDNVTYGIIFHGNYAWISTYNGISSYNLKQKIFRNFYSNIDGLTENEFNRNSYLKDNQTNNLYFGTVNGINSFNPDHLSVALPHARLFASTISKWDNSRKAYVNVFPMQKNNEIVMNPADHFLNINLGLSDYSNPEKVTFSYRVRGLTDDWVTLTNQHTIQLSGLAAGIYNIDVKALDSHGSPVTNELHYEVTILKSFYQTIWFYLIILVIIIIIISYVAHLRIKNLKQMSNLRERIATDLHDDVGSLLTRITMNSDSLKNNINTPEQSATKLSKISVLSRYAASSMNDILWTIDSQNNFTGNLADRLREHADEMLLPLSIDISYHIEVELKESISSERRQALYLIFKECISNIIKHSKATKVKIAFTYHYSNPFLRIENNGAEGEIANRGQGLRNIKLKAERVHTIADIIRERDLFIVEISGNVSLLKKIILNAK